MYDCVTGIQIPDNFGCIMADEMVNAFLLAKIFGWNKFLIIQIIFRV